MAPVDHVHLQVKQEEVKVGQLSNGQSDVTERPSDVGVQPINGGRSDVTKNVRQRASDIDGHWAWVVLVSTLVTCIVGSGQIQSVNIYFVVYLDEFKQSRSFTAWISAAQNTALCITGPICSFVLQKFGARLTMITGSLLMASCFASVFFANSIPYLIVVYAFVGASQCLLTGGALSSIAMYFQRRTSFALGIMMAGGGLGSMVTGLQLEWAMETFGWRGAMLIQSGIALQLCVCASLVYALPRAPGPAAGDENHNDDGAAKAAAAPSTSGGGGGYWASVKGLYLNPEFWWFVLSSMGIQANFSTMMTVFKGFVVSAGLEDSFKMVITTAGVGGMVGRVLCGPISHLLCPPLHFVAMSVACAVCNALYMAASAPWILGVVGAAFGFCQGQMIVTSLLSLSYVFGQKEMPLVRGQVMVYGILSSMSFPPMAGYTVDVNGNYNTALMMASCASMCCAICGTVTYILHRRRTSAKHSYDVTDHEQKQTPAVNVIQFERMNSINYAPPY